MSKYQKPELVVSGDAVQAIQSMSKTAIALDAQPPHEVPATNSAYEADE